MSSIESLLQVVMKKKKDLLNNHPAEVSQLIHRGIVVENESLAF